jgi:hypothetical protein
VGMSYAVNMNRKRILKFSDHPFKSYDFKNLRSIDVKIFLPLAPDHRLIYYPVRGSLFD